MLGGFGLASVEAILEQAPDLLAAQTPHEVARTVEPDDADGVVGRPVAPGVALCLGESPEATHEPSVGGAPDVNGYGSAVPVRAKRFEYAIAVERTGRMAAEGEAPIELDDAWSPDHLLLAALARCTIQSLRFHAERAGVDMVAGAEASGLVTKREEDDRYAFVALDVALDVELDTDDRAEIDRLLEFAERDCFVGSSTIPKPRYRWRVNGSDR